MTRSTRALIVSLLVLITVVVHCAADTTAFKYPESKADEHDISFYQPPLSTASYPLVPGKKVKNVILLIGDGMGHSQVALARFKTVGLEGKLHMERMPVAGMIRTHSANKFVTDSAAAGTALACGIKTNNGMIGMTPGEQVYATILEAAQANGMATGLVVTSTITHATPASFASHVKSRGMETTIAEQLIARKVNVLLGGGRKNFLPKSDPNSGRKDDRDLIAEAKQSGYLYAETTEELLPIKHPYLLGLFQKDALTTMAPEPSLACMTTKAIKTLRRVRDAATDRRKGFFLMVEGSQIDWACHSNDAPRCVRQTLLFDEAIKAAIDFAVKDGRTLVIVTSDHETGGLTIPSGNLAATKVKASWSTRGHSGLPVPVYALGPQAELFSGVYDNTDLPKRIAHVLGINPFPMPIQ